MELLQQYSDEESKQESKQESKYQSKDQTKETPNLPKVNIAPSTNKFLLNETNSILYPNNSKVVNFNPEYEALYNPVQG